MAFWMSPILLQALTRTPSADNSQPWRFNLSGEHACCEYGVRAGHADPFGPMGHASLIAGGAMHESISALLAHADAGAITVRIEALGWSLVTPDLTNVTEESPAASALLGRHTNRHPYQDAPISWSRTPRTWQAGTRVVILSTPADVSNVGTAVRLCSAVRFNTRELHEWLFSSIRWTREEATCGDGLDIASLHLPPGGRQFMRFISPWSRMSALNKLGLYRIMAAVDAKLIAQAPTIIALTGGNSPTQIWEAGRAMMDVWVSLNAAGYAVHPYYVVTDIANRLDAGLLAPEWKAGTERALGLMRETLQLQADERIHLLLRVGRPTMKAVRSRRLPLEQLVVAE